MDEGPYKKDGENGRKHKQRRKRVSQTRCEKVSQTRSEKENISSLKTSCIHFYNS